MPDIFDRLLKKKKIDEIFVRAAEIKARRETDIFAQIDKAVPSLVRAYIKANQPKEKPQINADDIIRIARHEIGKIPKQEVKTVEKVIEKHIVKEAKPILIKDEELKKEIEDLKAQIELIKESFSMVGGSGVIGLPNPQGNNGKVLQVENDQPKWKTAVSSSAAVYTPTNVTTDRSYDAANTSLGELANIVGSLIVDFQAAGFIK